MSKRYYVFSTLSNANRYVNHLGGGADLMQPAGDGVLIAGGANVADNRLETPDGVMTAVSEEDLAYLRENDLFKLHEKNGFVTVRSAKADPEVVAADMESREPSAPLVAADLATTDPQPAGAAADTAPKSSRRA